MEAHNFELGLIKLSKMLPPPPASNKNQIESKQRKAFEHDTDNNQESLERNDQENNDQYAAGAQLLPIIEEDCKDNEVKDTKDDELLDPGKRKPNTTVNLTVATKIK